MRFHYMSDLHLESQAFPWRLPEGDVLILAGDLCHAACLDPTRRDKYAMDQRDRVLRFRDAACANFDQVIAVIGNHEHYDGIFEDTAPLMRTHLEGITLLDNDTIDFGGLSIFGTTLWSDFEGRRPDVVDGLRRRIGEYFFVRTRDPSNDGRVSLAKFRPEDALHAHDTALAALSAHLSATSTKPTIVVSHHAPSLKSLNPEHRGNGLDGAFASALDAMIASCETVPVWIHGHTHIRKTYRIGKTQLRVNCRGYDGKDASAASFQPATFFDI